ncbi:MAG: hypothetical protein LBJ44_05385 [Propionibacteriaceae bacterium]|jgi:hypothetical protein|nr:hypothetical protein [Propionibacteriaceae bacterium]
MTTTIDRTDLASDAALERELIELIRAGLKEHDLTGLGPLPELADRMLSALPQTDSPWAEALGPVYTTRSLIGLLGVTRQAISQAAQSGAILRLITSDQVAVYPAFQFDRHGARLPGLAPVLNRLAQGSPDPYVWALWLNSPDHDGLTWADRLRLGQLSEALEQAELAARAWSQP